MQGKRSSLCKHFFRLIDEGAGHARLVLSLEGRLRSEGVLYLGERGEPGAEGHGGDPELHP